MPGRESFEDYPLTIATYRFGWPETPFAFVSGLILTSPIPNGMGSGNPVVTSCETDSGFYGVLCSDLRRYIPDGFALMVAAATAERPFEFALPAPVRRIRVAATVTSPEGEDRLLRMDAFDDAGELVASDTIRAGPFTRWPDNWLSVRTGASVIAKVRIYADEGAAVSIDDFHWQ